MTDAAKTPKTFEQKLENSTQLKSITYDAASRKLSVIFKSGAGWVYIYSNVEPFTWARICEADSLGSAFHYEIKTKGNKYPFEKRLAPMPDGSIASQSADPCPLPQTED